MNNAISDLHAQNVLESEVPQRPGQSPLRPIGPTPVRRAKSESQPPNFRTLDRLTRALLARATQGISPVAVAETWADWALHLAAAPGKRLELIQHAAMTHGAVRPMVAWRRRGRSATRSSSLAAGDRRFSDPAWSQWPFNVLAQGHLSTEAWWREATTRRARASSATARPKSPS